MKGIAFEKNRPPSDREGQCATIFATRSHKVSQRGVHTQYGDGLPLKEVIPYLRSFEMKK
jgi:hypothetical protein